MNKQEAIEAAAFNAIEVFERNPDWTYYDWGHKPGEPTDYRPNVFALRKMIMNGIDAFEEHDRPVGFTCGSGRFWIERTDSGVSIRLEVGSYQIDD